MSGTMMTVFVFLLITMHLELTLYTPNDIRTTKMLRWKCLLTEVKSILL